MACQSFESFQQGRSNHLRPKCRYHLLIVAPRSAVGPYHPDSYSHARRPTESVDATLDIEWGDLLLFDDTSNTGGGRKDRRRGSESGRYRRGS